jgi:ssDNA-binding Zn-finger/Zn-ribbon topoisomerase 1
LRYTRRAEPLTIRCPQCKTEMKISGTGPNIAEFIGGNIPKQDVVQPTVPKSQNTVPKVPRPAKSSKITRRFNENDGRGQSVGTVVCAIMFLIATCCLLTDPLDPSNVGSTSAHPQASLICLLSAVGTIFFGALVFHNRFNGKSNCPTCNEKLVGIRKKGHVNCPVCHRYSLVAGESLTEVLTDTVAAEHMFGLEISDFLKFPDICCACGKPKFCLETVESSAGQARRISIPHCNKCQKGASLIKYKTALTESDKMKNKVNHWFNGLGVKSYLFYCEYLKLNGMWKDY